MAIYQSMQRRFFSTDDYHFPIMPETGDSTAVFKDVPEGTTAI